MCLCVVLYVCTIPKVIILMTYEGPCGLFWCVVLSVKKNISLVVWSSAFGCSSACYLLVYFWCMVIVHAYICMY